MRSFVEINDIYCHRLGALSFNKSGFTSVYALFPVSKHTYDAVNTLYARNPSPFSCSARFEPIYHPTSANDGVLILALFDHGAHLSEDHKIDLCIALPDGVTNPVLCDLVVLYSTDSPDYATQQLMRRAAEATRINGLDRYEMSGRIYITTPRIRSLKGWEIEQEVAETDLPRWTVANPCIVGQVKSEKKAVGLAKRPIRELIKKVIFSGPVTLVYWTDGGMTKVRRAKGERDDKEKAIGMALLKHLNGEKASYISHLGEIIESAGVVKPNPRPKKRKKDDGDNA